MNFWNILFVQKHGGSSTTDFFEELLAESTKPSKIKTLTGTLPLTVRSRASQILKNYIIYGTASGAGVETENLWDAQSTSLIQRVVNAIGDICWSFVITEPGIYTAKCFEDHSGYVYAKKYTISTDTYENPNYLSLPETSPLPRVTATATVDADNIFIVYYPVETPISAVINHFNRAKLCVVKDSTVPSTYIPHGYKLPITVTSNGTTTDYPVYIGDSQLMEGEYVDYEEQKIYKLIDGVLTPTDPPVPLPDITIPEGEVTIDIDGELKPQATVRGRIEQIT